MDVNFLESEDERSPLDFESISKAEIEVLGLIPELCPRLNSAYCRYMRMVGYISCSDEAEERQKAADKEKFSPTLKDWPDADPAHNANLCALFMHNFCDLPFDQAYAWHRRVEAQEWRQGLKRVNGVTVSEQYAARMEAETNKLTTAALVKEDGTTTRIDAVDVPF
ncbi:hypothetical protein ACP2AV_07350 [Aliiroseovarius sp. PTFE2010]|uniref:hypothetical protein n=1 Tax=Aliiroseovarius sp. PTFE2010 TaxID=3417190 RepID=UPI003CF9C257